MAKNKKKKQQKDFQKVKLKVGKKLPRGLNETVATFKTRGINIKKQLKDSRDEQTTTRRQQNINDVLSQTQHHSSSVRLEALNGVREIITMDASVLHSNLARILEKVTTLTADSDGSVRATLCKLYKVMFPLVPANQIAPFYGLISAHLAAAMTHIHDEIQMDSLNILDLCLENYPGLVTSHAAQMLPNFIEQISRNTSKGDSRQRTLLVNPNSALSSQKGRLQVLQRIHNMYKALVQNPIHVPESISNTLGTDESNTTKWNTEAPTHVFVTSSNYADFHDQRQLFSFSENTGKSAREPKGRLSEEDLQHNASTLIPLLLECWAEACPMEQDTNKSGQAVNEEVAAILWHVLSIIHLMLRLLDNHTQVSSLIPHLEHDLVTAFMSRFPYAIHGRAASAKQKQANKRSAVTSSVPVSELALNLKVCQMMSYFISGTNDNNNQQGLASQSQLEWRRVLIGCLLGLEARELDRDHVVSVVSIVHKLIHSHQDLEGREELLEKVYSLYKSRILVSAADIELFLDFFSELAFSLRSNQIKSSAVKAWVSTLPKVFGAILKHHKFAEHSSTGLVTRLIHFMSRAGTRQEPKFISNLHDLIFVTLLADNEFKLLLKLTTEDQLKLLQLIHWLPAHVEKWPLDAMTSLCRTLDVGVTRAVLEIVAEQMNERFERRNNQLIENQKSGRIPVAVEKSEIQVNQVLQEFLSLVFSLVMGKPTQDGYAELACTLTDFHVQIDSDDDVTQRLALTQECVALLRQWDQMSLRDLLLSYMLQSWNSSKNLPLMSNVCVLHLLQAVLELYPGNNSSKDKEISDETLPNHETMDIENDSQESNHVTKSELIPILSEVVISICEVLYQISHGKTNIRVNSAPQNENINMSIFGKSNLDFNKSNTRNMFDTNKIGSKMDTDSSKIDNSETNMDENQRESSISSELVTEGFRICRCLVEKVPNLRAYIMELVIERISSHTGSDISAEVESATSILSSLVLPEKRMKKTTHGVGTLLQNSSKTQNVSLLSEKERSLLNSFVNIAPSRCDLSRKFWWSDFVYRLSLLH